MLRRLFLFLPAPLSVTAIVLSAPAFAFRPTFLLVVLLLGWFFAAVSITIAAATPG